MTPFRPFGGIEVLELSSDWSGAATTGAMLAAFGAGVTRCDIADPPGGPAGVSAGAAAAAARLHGAKQPAADPRAALARGGWDVVLADGSWRHGADPHKLDAVSFAEAASVVTWVTPYGRHAGGDARASDFTLQADAGVVEVTGHADGPGVRAGFPLGAVLAACIATTTTAAALAARERGQAHPREIDVSVFDALYSSLTTQLPARWQGDDGPPRAGNRHPMAAPWNTYPCNDGWISVCTMSERQWRALCELIERPDWAGDERLATAGGRVAHAGEIDAAIAGWTRARQVEQALAELRAVGVACGSIRSLARARRHAGLPLDDPGVPVPGLFVADDVPADRDGAPVRGAAAAKPLAGLRVLEVGAYTSAPVGARFLAGLGATVTKAEPPQGDPCRRLASQVAGAAYLFHINNTDKRSVLLGSDDAAREQASELLADADVLVSNLSERMLAGLQLDAASVAREAPGLLHCVVTGFDRRSPDAGLLAFDTVVQAMCGMMEMTGMPDAPPVRVGISAIDYLGAMMTATQIASWWLWRSRGGPGGSLELPLHDIGLWACADAWDRPADAVRMGNRHPDLLVQDVFPTRDDAIAITVDRVEDPGRLRTLIPDLAPGDAGHAHAVVRAWCAARGREEALAALADAGIAAAPASTLQRIISHTRARARGVLAVAPDDAPVPLLLGYPWWFDGQPPLIGTLAPASPGSGAGGRWEPARRAPSTR